MTVSSVFTSLSGFVGCGPGRQFRLLTLFSSLRGIFVVDGVDDDGGGADGVWRNISTPEIKQALETTLLRFILVCIGEQGRESTRGKHTRRIRGKARSGRAVLR